MRKIAERALWVLAILGFIVGLYGLYQRFAFGHEIASYGSYVPWGLWVAAYITFIGTSAGAVGTAAVIFMNRRREHYGLARLAILVALVTFIAGMLNIWLDLGHPFRAWRLYLHTSPTSVMGWMAWVYALYGIVLLVGLWLTRGGDVPPLVERYALIVLAFAVAFAGAEGALFGVVSARPLWESGLTPLLFLVEGALFGLGLVTAVAYVFGHLSSTSASRLGSILLWLLAALIVIEWAEFSTGLYAAVPSKSRTLQTILTGPYWWVFWIFHVALGIVIPGILLLVRRGQPVIAGAAGALIAAMGLASKLNLVIPALAQEEIAGLSEAFTGPGLQFQYFPTLSEWLVFVWTVSLAGLLLLAGGAILKMVRTQEVG